MHKPKKCIVSPWATKKRKHANFDVKYGAKLDAIISVQSYAIFYPNSNVIISAQIHTIFNLYDQY